MKNDRRTVSLEEIHSISYGVNILVNLDGKRVAEALDFKEKEILQNNCFKKLARE